MAKKGKQPNEIPYSKDVENHVRKGIRSGVAMQVIFEGAQHLQNCPRNYKTFYNKYGDVVRDERFRLQEEIGDAVMKGVREGNPKLVEFAARARANWNPSVRVEDVDENEADEAKDAVTRLAQLLGKDSDG